MPETEPRSQFYSRLRGLIGSFLAGSVVTFCVCLVLWKTPTEHDVSVAVDVPRSVQPDRRPSVAPSLEQSGKVAHAQESADSLGAILQMDSVFAQTTALHNLIGEFDADQLDQVLTEIGLDASPLSSESFKAVVYRRYVEVDPTRALDGLRSPSSDPTVSRLLNFAITSWARIDYTGAVDYLRSFEGTTRQQLATSILVARPDLSDAEQTEYAEEFGIESFLAYLSSMRSTQADPKTAWHEALNSSTGGTSRRVALGGIARAWVREDPATALSEISSSLQSSSELRKSILRSLIYEMAADDPESALQLVQNQPESSDKEFMLEGLFDSWGRNSPEEAFSAAAAVSPVELSEKLTKTVFEGWASNDPYAVLDVLSSIPESMREAVVERALYQIGSDDPHSVLKLAPGLVDLSSRSSSGAVTSALNKVAEDNLKQAVDWINQKVEDEGKNEYISETLMSLSYSKPQEAFDVALTLPTTTMNSPEFGVAMGAMYQNLEMAKKLVPKVRDERWRAAGYAAIGSRLVATDSGEALAYGRSIEEDLRPDYYSGVFMGWAESNFDDALSNISRVPEGPSRDRAMSSLVVSRNALERSSEWVRRHFDRIEDKTIRSRTAMLLARSYTQRGNTELAEEYRQKADTGTQNQ